MNFALKIFVFFITGAIATSGIVIANHNGGGTQAGFILDHWDDRTDFIGQSNFRLASNLNIQEYNITNASYIKADKFEGDGSALIGVSGVPTGSIILFAINSTTPNNYLDADGSIILKSEYPELCDTIGGNYGVDNLTHCQLPNMTV